MTTDAIASTLFTFDVDVDEVWLGEDASTARRPVTLSQGGYEARVGVPLVLALLAEHDVTGTFFVPGRVVERFGGLVESIAEAGHELAHHGYTHRAPAELSEHEERMEFERSVEAFARIGIDPLGYRAPSWDLSPQTLILAREFGLRYSSNFMDDVRSYRHEESGLVEIPVHWTLDDAAHFWFAGDESWTRKIATNEEADSIFSAESEGLAALGGVCVYTFHPQIVGRPGRLPVLRAALERALEDPRVRVKTAREEFQDFEDRSMNESTNR